MTVLWLRMPFVRVCQSNLSYLSDQNHPKLAAEIAAFRTRWMSVPVSVPAV
jgi:hypothetical protein